MRLLRYDQLQGERELESYRASRTPTVFGFVVLWGASVAAATLLVEHLPELSGLAMLLWPFITLGAVALLALDLTVASDLRASFRPTNWVMKFSLDGVYVNLRLYQNAGREDCEDIVAYFDFKELECARKVTIINHNAGASGESTIVEKYVQLEVAGSAATRLAQAVKKEQARPGIVTKFLGVISTRKSQGSPVLVVGSGLVRVAWSGQAVLRVLAAAGVASAPNERFVEDGGAVDRDQVDDRLLELCERGRTVEAIAFARRSYCMSLTEAHDFVHGLTEEAA